MSHTHPCPWLGGSVFGPGPRRPLSQAQVWQAQAMLHAWKRDQTITRATRDVGLFLLRCVGADGRLEVTEATIARDPRVACHPATVGRAKKRLAALGFLRWQRLLRMEGDSCQQAPNGYELLPGTGAAPLPPLVRAAMPDRVPRGTQNAGQFRRPLINPPLPPLSVAQMEMEAKEKARRDAALALQWAKEGWSGRSARS